MSARTEIRRRVHDDACRFLPRLSLSRLARDTRDACFVPLEPARHAVGSRARSPRARLRAAPRDARVCARVSGQRRRQPRPTSRFISDDAQGRRTLRGRSVVSRDQASVQRSLVRSRKKRKQSLGMKTTLSQAWSGNCIRGPQCAFEMSMFMCPAVHKLTRN